MLPENISTQIMLGDKITMKSPAGYHFNESVAITALPSNTMSLTSGLPADLEGSKVNDYAVCLGEYKRLLSKREDYLKASIGVVYVALPTRLQYCLKVQCGYLYPCMVNPIP